MMETTNSWRTSSKGKQERMLTQKRLDREWGERLCEKEVDLTQAISSREAEIRTGKEAYEAELAKIEG